MEHMDKTTLTFGDIVQVCPIHPECGACFAQVIKVTSTGIDVFIPVPTIGNYYRRYFDLTWDEFEYCGYSVWAPTKSIVGLEEDNEEKCKQECLSNFT